MYLKRLLTALVLLISLVAGLVWVINRYCLPWLQMALRSRPPRLIRRSPGLTLP